MECESTNLDIPVKDVLARRGRPNVRIVMIKDPTHPAFGQRGLVSLVKIAPRSHVLDYMGIVHSESSASQSSDYALSFERSYGLSIDAERAGNEARMINDYRGVVGVKRPNVEFHLYRDLKTGEVRMGIWALSKPIGAGEELLLSYGKGFWNSRSQPTNSESEAKEHIYKELK
ncbi:hypothetical protein HDU67_008622 [Dinochytrium kinnereticum]|nr:hypothetical protein HDU67_008622 [Dinochytrium kinnereticum]